MAKKCEQLHFPNLKLIQLTSAGFDDLNLPLFTNQHIAICNAANVYNVGMAEFAIYAMLMSAKRYNRSINNRSIRFRRNYCYISELYGKTIGIMGVGNIGTEVAKRATAFGMHVIGYANKTQQHESFDKIYHKEAIADFIKQCDYLVNTLPHNENTIGLLNAEVFAEMKPSITLINIGRRSIFNENDFLSFLRSHSQATAILDMFERIPNPITNPYRRLSNVVVLPGVTAISKEINIKLSQLIINNLSNLERGIPLINQINLTI
uniref:NAD(P)-dependent oxidoreductase n=1 Tax=Alistipes sp. TaxID=1872444 RepID=UPI0040578B91